MFDIVMKNGDYTDKMQVSYAQLNDRRRVARITMVNQCKHWKGDHKTNVILDKDQIADLIDELTNIRHTIMEVERLEGDMPDSV